MSTHQSTENLISDLDAELKRTAETIMSTAETIMKMQESLIIIGHRYAELQHQLSQERAVLSSAPLSPPMTELGTALSGGHHKSADDTSAKSRGQHQDEVSGAPDTDDAPLGADHASSGASGGDDLDQAFDQVGSAAARGTAAESAPAPARITPVGTNTAGAKPAPRTSTFGAPRRAATPAPTQPPVAPAPAAPATAAARSTPTLSRTDPLAGQGDQAARPRMRALGSASR